MGCNELNIEIQFNEILIECHINKSKICVDVELENSGISNSVCPIITEIDGGNAFSSYPNINGLLNGGSA